ncbi:MAG: hypothetical protein P1U41_09485 [Vicingaceae bacterium]|nr:hypothetical protein [Vicingaceae bacterium]
MINENKRLALDLIEDKLNPAEAKELVHAYYEKSINHYKLQKLKTWIANHNANTSYYDELINSLSKQKKEAIETIETGISTGRDIEFNGKLNFSLVA